MEPQSDSQSRVVEINGLETDFFKPAVNQYLSRKDFPTELVNQNDSVAIANQICGLDGYNSTWRNELVAEIYAQYSASGISLEEESALTSNLELLKNQNTLTVTTGQQLHIFLGPIFVANKILSCCAESRAFDLQFPDHNVVPVFWLASEDHDFEEIRSVRLYNEILTWDLESKGPVGRLRPDSLLPLVAQARQRIDQTPENLAFLDVCERAYSSCQTFAQATRQILHHYYGDLGIIVLDADSSVLKKRLVQNIEQDLFDHSNQKLIDANISTLKSHKIKPPINTRPINYFMISNEERDRIVQTPDGFQLNESGKTLSEDQVRKLLENSPEVFSPNALLRPVYQQTILPNLAYVSGPSEFLYWLEIKDLMEESSIPYPLLQIRKSVFFVSGKNWSVWEGETKDNESIFFSEEHFNHFYVKKWGADNVGIQSKLNTSLTSIEQVIDSLEDLTRIPKKKARKLLGQLQSNLQAEIDREMSHGIEELAPFKRIKKVKDKIWSENYVQERSKDIISSISEILIAKKSYLHNWKRFEDGRLITLLIN